MRASTLPTLLAVAATGLAVGLAIVGWMLGQHRARARFEAALAERNRQLADNAAVVLGLRSQVTNFADQLKRERSRAGTSEVARRASEAALEARAAQELRTRTLLRRTQARLADRDLELDELQLHRDAPSSAATPAPDEPQPAASERDTRAEVEERRRLEAEVRRLSTRAEALAQELQRAAEEACQDRERHRVALGAANGLVDQSRRDQARLGERLLEVTRALEAANRERTDLQEALGDAGARTRAATSDRIERELELSQAVADRDAQLGALQAKAERVDPLVRRLEDREALLRAVLFERDAATARLSEVGRRVEAEAGATAAESKRRRLLEARTVELEGRLAEAERRVASTSRERDQLGADVARLELELATAREESRRRDRRFRALAETNDQRIREMTQRIMELEAELLTARPVLTEGAKPSSDSDGRLYCGPSSVDE